MGGRSPPMGWSTTPTKAQGVVAQPLVLLILRVSRVGVTTIGAFVWWSTTHGDHKTKWLFGTKFFRAIPFMGE
jgi:hypothetical protein